MYHVKRHLIVFIILLGSVASSANENDGKKLSRRKRYTAFPDGSSFSVAVCTTIGQIGNPNVNFLSYALNWGVSYELPNDTWVTQYAHGFKYKTVDEPKHAVQRRSRRSFYEEVEVILDSMGYNGKDCIMRALCESRKLLGNTKGSMEIELLKKIFSFPSAEIMSREHGSTYQYDRAYRGSCETENCASLYSGCGFSLIALAFGKHSSNTANNMM